MRHRAKLAGFGSFALALAAAQAAAVAPTLVRDIAPGSGAGGFDGLSGGFTAFDGALYFAAGDGASGIELWRTDGTTAGTNLVTDLRAGPANGFPENITASNGRLYFSGYDAPGSAGSKAFVSDGTAAGTSRLVDTAPGVPGGFFGLPTPQSFTPFTNGRTLFVGYQADFGQELWVTDGTPAGTNRVRDIHPGPQGSIPVGITNLNGVAYFFADDKFTSDDGVSGFYDRELFRTDGTDAGTFRVKDINPGTRGSTGGNLAAFGGALYFTADDGASVDLWRTDGSTAGTVKVSTHGNTISNTPVVAGGRLYYVASTNDAFDLELYATDGTSGGLVRDINPTGESVPLDLTAFAGKLYFTADDGAHGRELWASDGTAAGTSLVKDLVVGESAGAPAELTVAGDALFFTSILTNDDGTVKTSLWTSDGTEAGTVKLFEEPGVSFGYAISGLTVLGDRLLFRAPGSADAGGFSHDVELYSIAVPEPASLAVAAASAGLIVRRRRPVPVVR